MHTGSTDLPAYGVCVGVGGGGGVWVSLEKLSKREHMKNKKK